MVKKRTWKRWPSEGSPERRVQQRLQRTGKGKGALPTRCPVCDTPLAHGQRLLDGPDGPDLVATLRCPNPQCPRAREIRDEGARR